MGERVSATNSTFYNYTITAKKRYHSSFPQRFYSDQQAYTDPVQIEAESWAPASLKQPVFNFNQVNQDDRKRSCEDLSFPRYKQDFNSKLLYGKIIKL